MKTLKIAVITCYFDPDYVRARALRAALKAIPGVKPIIVKNTHKGLLRYPEVIWKLWQVKKNQKPDVYLLTFRGQEILPAVLAIAGKQPVWFDELIVPIAYATGEKHSASAAIKVKHFLARVTESAYRRWLSKCAVIMADTNAHAELSARVSQVNLSKYIAVPVGADDKLFQPAPKSEKTEPFQVFFYSFGMQPLHGTQYILDAAVALKDDSTIEFLIVGGKKPLEKAVQAALKQGAHITYKSWIPFDELVNAMHAASLNLGGPFGDTPQAQHVVTTKTYQILAAQEAVVVGASEASDEYFVHKENALVVPQGSSEELVKVIRWAQKHPDELLTIAANGRKLYDKQFSATAIASRLKSLVG